MQVEIIVALIALAGSILSVLMSFVVALRSSKIERIKKDIDLYHKKIDKLLEKRHSEYPKMYQLVSHFKDRVTKRKATEGDFAIFYENLRALDTEMALLFHGETSGTLHDLQHQCYRFLQKNSKYRSGLLANEQFLTSLVRKMARLELAIKAELGIFEEEFEVGFRPKRYGEIRKKVRGRADSS